MRTKYGSQLQIVQLAGLLGPNETLRFMAVANGPSLPDRNNHGLLALSDCRLIFVPRSTASYELVSHDLGAVNTLLWTKHGRVGTLTLLGHDLSCSFTDVATADGRELMALAVRLAPHVQRAGHL